MAADSVTVSPTFNGDSVSLTSGMIVRLKPGANNNVVRAQADSAPHVQGVNGVVVSGSSAPTGVVTVVSVGRQTVQMESALTPAVGDTVYVSAAVAGKGTNVIPGIVLPIGSIADISGYASGKTVEVDVVTASSESGAGGTFPGFGGAPPAVAAASDGGAAGTASRSDHTHAGVASLNGEQGAVTAQSTGGTVLITEPAPGQVNFEVTNPVPAFATPVDLGPNEGVSGIASTIIRSDAIPGQKIEAQWPIANPRYYAVDGQAGNDANAGFSDVSSAAAGAVAKKTLAGLAVIFPRIGAGRKVVILIASTSYAGQGGLDLILGGCSGYGIGFPLVRATATVPSAGAVAFAGDANDKICAGMMTAPGCNAGGYTPTGTPTATTIIQCIKNGGGAPAFGAEPAAPLMYRMRFDSATTTAALRNLAFPVIQVIGTDTLVVQNPQQSGVAGFPAVPTAADVFYLEGPGCTVDRTYLDLTPNSRNFDTSTGFQVVGINVSSTLTVVGGRALLSGCVCTAFEAGDGAQFYPNALYNEEAALATIVTGMPLVVAGVAEINSGAHPWFNGNLPLMLSTGALEVTETSPYVPFASCCFGGLLLRNAVGGVATANQSPLSALVGGQTHSIGAPLKTRVRGTFTVNGGLSGSTAGIVVMGSSLSFGACDIEQTGAHPAISLVGQSQIEVTSALVGSTGNTDVGLDLTLALGCTVLISSLPTLTGTAGDVRLSDGTIVSWPTAAAGIIDTNGNHIFAAGNAPDHPIPVATGAGVLTVTNAPGGATAYARYFKIPDGAGGFLTIGSLT